MTAIAVALDKDQIILGSDSQVTIGAWMKTDSGSKIKQLANNIWLAEAGSCKRLQYAEEVITSLAAQQEASKFSTPLSIRIATKLADRYMSEADDDDEKSLRMELILVCDNAAWFIANDASVIPIKHYLAAGTGGSTMMGTLFVLYGKVLLQVAVEQAVRAAIQHSPECGGEAYTISIPR